MNMTTQTYLADGSGAGSGSGSDSGAGAARPGGAGTGDSGSAFRLPSAVVIGASTSSPV